MKEKIAAVILILTLFLGMGMGLEKLQSKGGESRYGERVIYQQESVESIEGRAISNPTTIPYHKTMMVTFGVGDDATSQAITWDVGDFSGLHVPDPKQNYQRGINNSWYGSTAVQMYQNYAGLQLHTYSASEHPASNLANAQMAYWWSDSDNERVWGSDTSIMRISLDLQVPKVWVEGGAVAYSNVILLFKDTKSGRSVWFIVNAYDVRGEQSFSEWIGWDDGTGIPMIVTYFGSGCQYGYLDDGSSIATGSTWSGWRYFGFLVNTWNFTRAIEDVNSKYSLGMSENPEDYIITEITVQAEIYWPQGSNGHIGISVHNLRLSELSESIPEFGWM